MYILWTSSYFILSLIQSSYTYDDYAQELRERLRTTNRIAKENLKEEKGKGVP